MSNSTDVVRPVSTTWEWRLCKIEPSTRQGTARSSASSLPPDRRRWNVRKGVTPLQVRYRGGSEDSWLVRLDGGRWWRIPGWLCFTDALTQFEVSW